MHRFIDQINVSITTNRTCTLRCDHCYIAPHLFSDKTQMSTATFRRIFEQVEALFHADHNLKEVEWEAIGGETTMMPFEWWEANLPWALDWIHAFNQRHRIKGSLNFLSNLIYTDKRYTRLLNTYGHHPAFCLYTSWEPDTNRFGKRDQLYPRFRQTLASIDARHKILDLILTKSLVERGAQWVLDEFLPLGINDFSIKMLSPYGSGKQFFEPNMVDFEAMTSFLLDMARLKPDHVSFTPQDEMQSSLFRGTSFQCNGNFKYDIAIEPDGLTTFNASQTADEAALGLHRVHIDDPFWATKVMLENKPEESAKLTLAHPACHQCEYMHYCNAGWYHYKIHDPTVIARYAANECPGYRKLWDRERDQLPAGARFDRSEQLHQKATRNLCRAHLQSPAPALPDRPLSAWRGGYAAMIEAASVEPDCRLVMDVTGLYGKSLLQWLWFLDDRRWPAWLGKDILMASDEASFIVRHAVYGNFGSVTVAPEAIWAFVAAHPEDETSCIILEAAGAWEGLQAGSGPRPASPAGLVHDARNEELYRWLAAHPAPAAWRRMPVVLSEPAVHYLRELGARLDREERLRHGLAKTG